MGFGVNQNESQAAAGKQRLAERNRVVGRTGSTSRRADVIAFGPVIPDPDPGSRRPGFKLPPG